MQGNTGSRKSGQIAFTSVREGDQVGEHQVSFQGPGESLTLTHRATDRSIYARGALRAARWLAGRAPGLYSMADILMNNQSLYDDLVRDQIAQDQARCAILEARCGVDSEWVEFVKFAPLPIRVVCQSGTEFW